MVEDNVCYNQDDIALIEYETAQVRRNITQDPISFDQESPNGTTTVSQGNVASYPTGL